MSLGQQSGDQAAGSPNDPRPVTGKLREYVDAKFQDLNGTVNNFVMRYNHSKGGFDLVSADGILVKETETPLPNDFLEVLESEMNLEDITEIGDVDAGKF